MTATIRVRTTHVTSEQAYAQVRARSGIDEIDDAVAVTIASWWQSPGTIGRHLAALASGAQVDSDALQDDITATRRAEHYYGSDGWPRMSSGDRMALDALSTWIIQRTRAGRDAYRPKVSPVMRYANVVFLQGEDADETLEIIERDGQQAGLSHLRQWQTGDSHGYDLYANPPHGADDRTYLDGDLILTYSHRLGYAGLAMRLPS